MMRNEGQGRRAEAYGLFLAAGDTEHDWALDDKQHPTSEGIEQTVNGHRFLSVSFTSIQ